MELRTLEGQQIRLTDTDGYTYTGLVSDYVWTDDNDPEEESIILDYPTRNDGLKYESPIEFRASEIQSIEVIS